MSQRLAGQRVVVTQAVAFMGPAICELFRDEGAEVLADSRDLRPADSARRLIDEMGRVDVLVANLIVPNPRVLAHETTDPQWATMFDIMVHPLHRLTRAVLPQMLDRRSGKIVVIGSANGLRGTVNRSAYSAARGAQHAYVRNVGVEVAPYNVQVNATAQIFVANPTSFSPAVIQAPGFADRLREVPAGRVASGRESALLALFLASAESDFLVGQIVPFTGGWST